MREDLNRAVVAFSGTEQAAVQASADARRVLAKQRRPRARTDAVAGARRAVIRAEHVQHAIVRREDHVAELRTVQGKAGRPFGTAARNRRHRRCVRRGGRSRLRGTASRRGF